VARQAEGARRRVRAEDGQIVAALAAGRVEVEGATFDRSGHLIVPVDLTSGLSAALPKRPE